MWRARTSVVLFALGCVGAVAAVLAGDVVNPVWAVVAALTGGTLAAAAAWPSRVLQPPALPVVEPPAALTSGDPPAAGRWPQVWNLPPRNPNFTGRQADLARLAEQLAGATTVTVQALRGMGGVGKTQTVLEYAYRHAAEFDVVWWINAEQAGTLAGQISDLALQLGLPQVEDPTVTLRAVHRHLRGRDRWLLIFDNAEILEEIQPLLPGGSGRVLITTRNDGFQALGDVVDLDVMDRADAIALLRRGAPTLDGANADQLADRLGDLPLALAQAAAYLHRTRMPPERYLALLATRAHDLYRRGPGLIAVGHAATVATVWSTSIDRLRVNDPAAVQLLVLGAWLAPEPIPLDVFTSHPALLTAPLATVADDPIAFADTVATLVAFSLARHAPATESAAGTLLLHRLVQDVTRSHAGTLPAVADSIPATGENLDLPPVGAKCHLAVLLRLLLADLPDDVVSNMDSWPRYRVLLPHALVVVERSTIALGLHGSHTGADGDLARTPSVRAMVVDTAAVFDRCGRYQMCHLRQREALPLLQQAMTLLEAVRGPDHPDVATAVRFVGRTLKLLGRNGEALPLLQRAVRTHQAVLGPDHPEVGADWCQLGRVLLDLGQFGPALLAHQRALRIHEAAHGPNHPEVAYDLGLIGWLQIVLGRHEQALSSCRRALRIYDAVRGPDHTEIANQMCVIGQALCRLGRYAEALPLHERAVHIFETALGPDHPIISPYLAETAEALSGLGFHTSAFALCERALSLQEATYDEIHPYIAETLTTMGQVLAGLGRDVEALSLYQRALRIQEATHCPDHPETARILDRFALSLSTLGRHGEAQCVRQRADRIRTVLQVSLAAVSDDATTMPEAALPSPTGQPPQADHDA